MAPGRGSSEDSHAQQAAADDPLFGRMNDPSCSACLRGLCGDEMEFCLVVEDGVIRAVKYYTEGCESTRLCGQAVARRVQGKTIHDALGISPREIIDSQVSLPEGDCHCAILAVSTLYRAIADLLLMP